MLLTQVFFDIIPSLLSAAGVENSMTPNIRVLWMANLSVILTMLLLLSHKQAKIKELKSAVQS